MCQNLKSIIDGHCLRRCELYLPLTFILSPTGRGRGAANLSRAVDVITAEVEAVTMHGSDETIHVPPVWFWLLCA